MPETVYALTDADGVVVNRVVADAAAIAELTAQIDDPDVETGELAFAHAYDVTGKDVGIGHRRSSSGRWSRPEPTPEQLARETARAAADEARAADEQFLTAAAAKLRGGGQLTAAERDRATVLAATGVTPAPPAAAPATGKP